MSAIGIIFVSFAVVFVTAMLFVGWVIYKIVSTIVMAVSAGRETPRLVSSIRTRMNPQPGQQRCARDNCRNINPPTARFCKCCGAALKQAAATGGVPPRLPVRMSA